MGKRLVQQRRGRGKGKFKVPSHNYRGSVKYPHQLEGEGIVEKIIHDTGHTAPLAQIRLENGNKELIIASEGMKTGQKISFDKKEKTDTGNIMSLNDIPEGNPVFNIELSPGDGGKMVRSAGNHAIVVSHDKNRTLIKLPSGKSKFFDSKCKATVGVAAGGGRREKPFLKAGTKHIASRARGKNYPVVKGVAMNPVSHPHGGGGHQHVGKGATVKKGASPGRKVGSIKAKRTGRK